MAATDTKQIIKDAEAKMNAAVQHLDDELARIRAGKASARILDNVRVTYYGDLAPLSNVASVTTPDAKTILITPWEKSLLKENNGETIRLGIPPLTEDRRRSLAKNAKQQAEAAKVSIRNARRDTIDVIKKAVKDGTPEDLGKDAEAEAQKIHDKYVKKVDDLYAAKEKEIMTV